MCLSQVHNTDLFLFSVWHVSYWSKKYSSSKSSRSRNSHKCIFCFCWTVRNLVIKRWYLHSTYRFNTATFSACPKSKIYTVIWSCSFWCFFTLLVELYFNFKFNLMIYLDLWYHRITDKNLGGSHKCLFNCDIIY